MKTPEEIKAAVRAAGYSLVCNAYPEYLPTVWDDSYELVPIGQNSEDAEYHTGGNRWLLYKSMPLSTTLGITIGPSQVPFRRRRMKAWHEL